MSWGPSDEAEWQEHLAAERASRRAYHDWWETGVCGDGSVQPDAEPADVDAEGGHTSGQQRRPS